MQPVKINVLIHIQTLLVIPQITEYWVCSFSLSGLSQCVPPLPHCHTFPKHSLALLPGPLQQPNWSHYL